jgi:hypothetical protein
MTQGLPVTQVVDVTASLTPIGASFLNLQTLLIVGDSNVIDTYQRIRFYQSLAEVGNDFSGTTPEYLAAEIYFDQTPSPTYLYIGRWASSASSGDLVSGPLSSADQVIANWTSIAAGSFKVSIDGSSFIISSLNFSAQTNLNGVASTVQSAIQSAGVTVPALPVITSATSGSLAQTTYYVKTTYNTANGETLPSAEASQLILIDNVPVVASPAANGPEVTTWNCYIASSTGAETLQNLSPIAIGTHFQLPGSGLISGAALPNTNTATTAGSTSATFLWNLNAAEFILTSGTTGTTSSVSFMTNAGTGTDISSQFLCTSALASYASSGVAAETPLAAVEILDNLTVYWYGLEFAAGTNNEDFTDADALTIAAYIEASTATTGNPHIFGLTTSEASALNAESSSDIGSELHAQGYQRTFYMYSSQNPYGVGGLYGKLLTVNFAAEDSMLTLMWQQLSGFSYETLSPNNAATLNAKRYNYYALFNNGVAIVVNGTMAAGAFVDEIFGLDGLVNYIQTDLFNFMVSTGTKIPQTDAGIAQLVTVCQNACQAFVNNGYLAAGTWTSAAVGPVQTGQTLSNGYYVWAAPISTQSAAQRDIRVSPTIQILGKEAGAVHDIIVNMLINQ